jgi:hypothetical protein
MMRSDPQLIMGGEEKMPRSSFEGYMAGKRYLASQPPNIIVGPRLIPRDAE